MGILSRFKDIMASNINAILDKLEDPEKMIDQLLRNISEDLSKVKQETAGVMAEQARQGRKLEERKADIEKYQSLAIKAVEAGNDDDARAFLSRKNELAAGLPGLEQAYALATENAEKMRQMHDKLQSELTELSARRDAIKAKAAVAKTQERINEMTDSAESAAGSIAAFERMEEKVDRMLDKANAVAELNTDSASADLKAIEAKYDGRAAAVEDELAAIKAKLGK